MWMIQMDEAFVDVKGLCEDLTKRELDYLLRHDEIDAEDFLYEAYPASIQAKRKLEGH